MDFFFFWISIKSTATVLEELLIRAHLDFLSLFPLNKPVCELLCWSRCHTKHISQYPLPTLRILSQAWTELVIFLLQKNNWGEENTCQ